MATVGVKGLNNLAADCRRVTNITTTFEVYLNFPPMAENIKQKLANFIHLL